MARLCGQVVHACRCASTSTVSGVAQPGTLTVSVASQNCPVNAFKARLDKIWLHETVKFVSYIGLGPNFSTYNGLGWIGSHKMDRPSVPFIDRSELSMGLDCLSRTLHTALQKDITRMRTIQRAAIDSARMCAQQVLLNGTVSIRPSVCLSVPFIDRSELSMGPFCVTQSNPTHYK